MLQQRGWIEGTALNACGLEANSKQGPQRQRTPVAQGHRPIGLSSWPRQAASAWQQQQQCMYITPRPHKTNLTP